MTDPKITRRCWWGCHWCNWTAPIRRRPFDRWRATREFRAHITSAHPGITYDNRALWGRRGQPKTTPTSLGIAPTMPSQLGKEGAP